MSNHRSKTTASFLEGGLPVAQLSAECQRDNNALRPPQNRLHIWWARRAPTISRAAILAALVPHDFEIDGADLPRRAVEPSVAALAELPASSQAIIPFLHLILREIQGVDIPARHWRFLQLLGVAGDADAAYRRLIRKDILSRQTPGLSLPDGWGYTHKRAFHVLPSSSTIEQLLGLARGLLGLAEGQDVVVADPMAGGGTIPLEALRYGLRVYSNDLNPVAALLQSATLRYPAEFGMSLDHALRHHANEIQRAVAARLERFYPRVSASEWWPLAHAEALLRFGGSARVREIRPAGPATARDYLWMRTLQCPTCSLTIPLSTNLLVAKAAGRPAGPIAAFPRVPALGQGDRCVFEILREPGWAGVSWPRLSSGESFHPSRHYTYKGGKAICPRCGGVVSSPAVKSLAQRAGLGQQMYGVAWRVPIEVRYGAERSKIREMWWFAAPSSRDEAAAAAATAQVETNRPRWLANDLLPREEIPEGEKTREPRNVGFRSWDQLFLPRQLLTNITILEEIQAAHRRIRSRYPPARAEALAVYLTLMLSKVLDYNSANTFWHTGSLATMHTFSRHDLAFRPATCELEGTQGAWGWAIDQVLEPYRGICTLIHGDPAHGHSEGTHSGGSGSGIRPEVIVPTVTNQDAAALDTPPPRSVHLICVDPPYYNNVQYAELSNFFYVWLKRALRGTPGLAHLFTEPLAETNREAVANSARWRREAQREIGVWQTGYDAALERLSSARVPGARGRPKKQHSQKRAKELALEAAGPRPRSARERADGFYEDKMAAVFRRASRLLHPAGRMVVMFNHKQTWAWRALGMALIRAGFEVRSSIPIHTEAESSLHIRGLDAARSTVLLLCMPREEQAQAPGNWGQVRSRIARIARAAAERSQSQGLRGTDLYLSALGPALGEVGRSWPVTDYAGRGIDLVDALDEAYRSVGRWRLEQLLGQLTASAELHGVTAPFSADAVDRDTQTLWLWLDTFQGETADSDDVRKLAKSLGVTLRDFKKMGLLDKEKALFSLRAPQAIDLRLLSMRLKGERVPRGRAARAADAWQERVFPNFVGAAVWCAISLMIGRADGPRGTDALAQWLNGSGYGSQPEFIGAYAVTLRLLEDAFQHRPQLDPWRVAATQARRGWDLLLKTWRV